MNESMTLNFADLTQKLRAGGKASQQNILDILVAGPGATFALVEFAAESRRMFFRNTLGIVNLINRDGQLPSVDLAHSAKKAEKYSLVLDGNANDEDLARQIYELAQNDSADRITVSFTSPEESAEQGKAMIPMQCLRILAALRIAAPVKSIRLRSGRSTYLSSLQSLALHCVDSLYLSENLQHTPSAIFEDLYLIKNAGLAIIGAEQRDLVEEYVNYMQNHGIENARSYADEIFAQDDAPSGGCGSGCGCGSGGCGTC